MGKIKIINEKSKTGTCIGRITACIIFLILLGFLLTRITYIFRPTYVNRQNLVGLSQEDVDMIYIGGSSAFVYWQPLKAWHDNGLTSYLYAHNTIFADNIKYYIQETRKTQDAKLYVIDARPFQYWGYEGGGYKIRWGLDGLDVFSMNRWQLIANCFSTRDTTEMDDRVTFDWDIIKYHTATENLASPDAWKLINNSAKQLNKGFEFYARYGFLSPPQIDYTTDDRAELHPTCQAILDDLLEYCKRENLNVLFVVSPFGIGEAHQKVFNTVGDIIISYGFNFLNTNSNFYYDEMGLDFSTDFYNTSHVNPLGASKYTAFLENYILDHYDLPNHAGDPAYSSWDEDYQRFAEEKVAVERQINTLIASAKYGIDIAKLMAATDDPFTWNIYRQSTHKLTYLIAQKGKLETPKVNAERQLLIQLGLSAETTGGIRVITKQDVSFSNAAAGETSYSGTVGADSGQGIAYMISNEDGITSIIVSGNEYSLNQDGINIVVVDTDYRIVVDVLTITCEDGHLVIKR